MRHWRISSFRSFTSGLNHGAKWFTAKIVLRLQKRWSISSSDITYNSDIFIRYPICLNNSWNRYFRAKIRPADLPPSTRTSWKRDAFHISIERGANSSSSTIKHTQSLHTNVPLPLCSEQISKIKPPSCIWVWTDLLAETFFYCNARNYQNVHPAGSVRIGLGRL